jgi:TorA maturation chaperone TorD/DNA-binding transcriptional regulator YdaS (Cro superfamily)
MGANALAKAIAISGGQSSLARRIGVKQGHIWHWLKRSGVVPAEYVIAIEQATGGKVSRRDLRPDLYPGDDAAPNPALTTTVARAGEIAEEDRLRTQCYMLLAQTLARPPSAAVLAALAKLDGDSSPLGTAFGALARAAAEATPAALEDEYHRLFIGLGRGELLPYGSYYLTGFLYERPLARLRDDMAKFGIARAADVAEPEDHIAALCEMMAGLITGAFGAPASLTEQQQFFADHVGPWAGRFFRDLERAESATFYRPVGTIGGLFMSIEAESFAMAA